MEKFEIIELLKDDSQYYNGIGRNYLSNSDISILINNPKKFGVIREDNKNFAEGRYFHQLLIEPEKAVGIKHVDVSTRTTKEYKSYIESNNLKFALLTKEKEEVEGLVNVMKSNIQFYDDIYADGNQFELPAITNIFDLEWKGKADIIGKNFIIDLKTTSDILKFKYSAKAYNYDSQAYIYQTLFGMPLYFYVIDKITEQLGIFRPTDSFLESGMRKVEKASNIYKKYFGNNPTDNIANYYIEDEL